MLTRDKNEVILIFRVQDFSKALLNALYLNVAFDRGFGPLKTFVVAILAPHALCHTAYCTTK